MLKFVKPREAQRAVRSDMRKNLESEMQSEDDRVYIGNLTPRLLTKLVDDGDISSQQCKRLFNAVREFYLTIARYLLEWCPLNEELVNCAYWLDLKNEAEHNFESVKYFVDGFPNLKNIQKDKIHSQFLNYQVLSEDDLPQVIRDTVASSEYGNCLINILWDFLGGVKVPSTNSFLYNLLLKVAKVIITILTPMLLSNIYLA